jgi:DNA-binding transcriptional MocR family regulator
VQWLARNRLPADPSQVALSNGCQHAMQLALLALARPGDIVLTEQLTFYGLKALAALLSLKLHGVEIDEDGLVPAALDTACRQTGAKVLYCIPTLHNPTTAQMPAARREEIAAICKRHGVTIIEDDIYGFLDGSAPPPLTTFAPDHAIYVTSFSKCVAPGLRVGFLKSNAATIERIATNLRGTTWMATPLMAEIATRLIRSGQAERMAGWQRTEAIARQEIAADLLDDAEMMTHPSSFHLWLKLPEPWRREDFTAVARRRGVGVAPADAFTVGRAPVPHAVRVGLSAANDRAELERALRILADIISGPAEQGFPIV